MFATIGGGRAPIKKRSVSSVGLGYLGWVGLGWVRVGLINLLLNCIIDYD